MSTPDKHKDWLEPPDWWKKWRPLRWLVAVLLLAGLWTALRPLLPEGRTPPRATPRPTAVVALVTPTPRAALPIQPAEPTPAPHVRPSPAATATAVATPVAPTPGPSPAAAPTAGALAKEEALVYEEESLAEMPAESEIAAFTRVEPDPVPLLASYRSYQGVDEIVFGLESAGFEPIVESRHPAVRDGIPPRDLDTVTVMQFRHWDVPGRLQLQFFNDRLFQAEFEPEDAARYKAAQQRELPQLKREESGRSELVVGHLRIASSLDLAVSDVGRKLGTRPFLIWQDRRLVRQRDEWDRRFALDAVP